VEMRALPKLPQPASWQVVLHRAFLANGDLEASYFEWKAAMARIDIAAAWPTAMYSSASITCSPGRK